MDDQSRMERAKQLGFTIPAYHGTGNQFTAFDLEKGTPRHSGGYAPYFSGTKAESSGYAKEAKGLGKGKGKKVLECLLRLQNPLVIDHMTSVSPEFYKQVTGDEWTDKRWNPKGYFVVDDLRRKYREDDTRRTWTRVYAHLKKLGYDGFVYPSTPSDYGNGTYTKYIVFDPKNIRLIKARFDPANSNSSDLMA